MSPLENTNNNTEITEQEKMQLEQALDGLNEEQLLEVFVEQMIEEKGIGVTDEEVRKEIKEDLKERMIYQVNRAILAALPEQQFEQVRSKLEDGTITPEELNRLTEEAGVDMAKITQDVMIKFREAYLNIPEQGTEI